MWKLQKQSTLLIFYAYESVRLIAHKPKSNTQQN